MWLHAFSFDVVYMLRPVQAQMHIDFHCLFACVCPQLHVRIVEILVNGKRKGPSIFPFYLQDSKNIY
jgi:hypothetical protein